MQHGERGASLPRQIARQRGKDVCDAHNAEKQQQALGSRWVNKLSKKLSDNTGRVVVERRSKRRKVLKKPPAVQR